MRRITRSLSAKLSLGILLLAIPIFVLSLGLLFLQSRYFIKEEATERVNRVLNTTLQRVRTCMSTVETATNANTWLVERYFQPDSLLSISHRIVTLNRHVFGCSISTEPDVFPEKGRACWVDHFDEYIDETLSHPIETIASYCKPFYVSDEQSAGKRRLAGVISCDLSFQLLAEVLDSVDYPSPNAYFMLIGRKGHFFYHPDSTKVFKKTIFPSVTSGDSTDKLALAYEMTSGNEGSMHVNVDGQLCFVTYCPVPGTDWSLALVCPDSDMLKSYRQLAHISVLLIALGLLFIVWLSYRHVGETISPLNGLLRISQRIAGGRYDEDIPTSDRNDAIGRLQNSFVAMQQSLRRHVGSIKEKVSETRQRNEELAQAMKMAEESVRQKGIFIQDVSHQVRTPLNIIQGFAGVLRNSLASAHDAATVEDALPEEEVMGITNVIKRNFYQLMRIVLMLYDSSDEGILKEMKLARNDLAICNEVACNCYEFTMTHFPDVTIRLESELPDDYCIRTNGLYLMRTIRELLINAAKYSDGQHIVFKINRLDGFVIFTIEDIGPGMAEKSKDLIFKPFTKVDTMSEGLGLGLPLSKRHATRLGGDLIYDESYQEGCRFILKIPDVR